MKIKIGDTFSNLTVIDKAPSKKNHGYWKCKCNCGNIVTIRTDSLTSGRTKSCGCLAKEVARLKGLNTKKDLTNQRYGKLVAIKPTSKRVGNNIVWECLCDCGKITYVSTASWGAIKSCGCARFIDLTGQKIGKLTCLCKINKTDSSGYVYWKCLCDCGSVVYKTSHALVNNRVLSCGCEKSKGERKISSILQQLNIRYEKEKTFEACVDKRKLRFDFYLPKYNCCIEYDGEQHFIKKDYFDKKDSLENRQNKDNIKNKYCEDNNILLIRIPYWDYDKIDKNYIISMLGGGTNNARE